MFTRATLDEHRDENRETEATTIMLNMVHQLFVNCGRNIREGLGGWETKSFSSGTVSMICGDQQSALNDAYC